MALEAGCDLLIYRTETAARIGYEALRKAIKDGKLDPEIVLIAAERAQNLKRSCLLPYQSVNVPDVGPQLAKREALHLIEKVEA